MKCIVSFEDNKYIGTTGRGMDNAMCDTANYQNRTVYLCFEPGYVEDINKAHVFDTVAEAINAIKYYRTNYCFWTKAMQISLV